MLEDHFPEVKIQIDEYNEFNNIVRSDKQLYVMYPKILNLCVASLFEKQIKKICGDIVAKPKKSAFSDAKLQAFVKKNANKYIDKIYASIRAYIDSNGQEVLSLQAFYDLFGGNVFEQNVEALFNCELSKQINSYEEFIGKITPCVAMDVKYESNLVFADNVLQQLKSNSFNKAKEAFLRLKERRNRIAHDFMCQFNDTYNDIICLYNDAALFVYALKTALSNLIDT